MREKTKLFNEFYTFLTRYFPKMLNKLPIYGFYFMDACNNL